MQADIREKAEVTHRAIMDTQLTVNSLDRDPEEQREVLAPIQGTSTRSNFTTRQPRNPPHQPPHHNQVDYSDSTTTSYNRQHVVKDHPLQSIREHFGITTEELVQQLQGARLRDIFVDLRDGGFQHNDYRTQPSKRKAVVLFGQGTIAEKQEYLIELLEYRTTHYEM
jgi:hypothetical protein